MTSAQAKKEIKVLREHTQTLCKSPAKARAFLIKAGILDKTGKRLAKTYRS
jgi:hypothetical protein